MTVVLAALAIYAASILSARISFNNFVQSNRTASLLVALRHVVEGLAIPGTVVLLLVTYGADAPSYLNYAAFFMMLGWAIGGVLASTMDSPYRESLQTMPKVINTASDRGLKVWVADMVNVAALPFFAGCALLVFGIAMLMRFGGRPAR